MKRNLDNKEKENGEKNIQKKVEKNNLQIVDKHLADEWYVKM